MTTDELYADLVATHRFPTDEEIAQVLREGTHEQIAFAMVCTANTHKGLRLAYTRTFREKFRA